MTMRAATLPWVEKYRPKSVDEVSHQNEVVDSLRKAIEQKNLPHLIFYGPPGTGKTSTILACARQLFGSEYRSRVMELNASDERGIGVVRNKIKAFAQTAVGNGTASAGILPPYKLIVLDEADSMTGDAQSALRRTMETYSKVTRFCIICNYISRLIPPIASRCAKFRFQPLPHEAMVARLQHICEQEAIVGCNDKVLSELIRQSEGDMRRAVQMLQSVHRLHGDEMTPQAVLDISGALPDEQLTDLFDVCRANDFDRMTQRAQDILAEGFPVSQIILQIFQRLVTGDIGLSNTAKSKVALQLAEADKLLIDGAGDFMQLMNVLASLTRHMHKS
mmetsp:Transcript_22880/g.37901  ORF Transcript_22880/g.37901 Transcript_22880/m.37901 type:complete len:334 (-) Transcript_22880:242-1243(-)|eukprot:CAMPEP_0119311044 /NCGR_PEP_ID=MMETSP1333-20130426/21383_1 /TAXON_ID=418940 /ORGANISM="Scyphosphaera apsteinii, Strain RCC1455" /LENGTH=333 /DNA_ID=CAMNT_0007315333 /DNA_START=25 /DNA_END=1026 /DNA_ORIENTATION=-